MFRRIQYLTTPKIWANAQNMVKNITDLEQSHDIFMNYIRSNTDCRFLLVKNGEEIVHRENGPALDYMHQRMVQKWYLGGIEYTHHEYISRSRLKAFW